MNPQSHKIQYLISIISLTFVTLLIVSSCKDTSATHVAGLLETCKGEIDSQAWTAAISTCADIENDEGNHLTAQAYMGRAGSSLFNIINNLLSSSATDGASSVLFGFIPDTTADANDFKSALYYLLGTDSSGNPSIQVKTQDVYLEGLLISSMLIFKELKTLLDLSTDVDGNFTTCSVNPADPPGDQCAFIPTLGTDPPPGPTPLAFSGLGSDFYTGICGHANDPSHDGTSIVVNIPPNLTIDKDITADGCTIQTSSPLYYNKVANAGFTGSTEITGLEVLDFYPMMDSGGNFSFEIAPTATPPELSFCSVGNIDPPDATDDKLNDCEILAMFTDPSSDLF